VNPNASQDLKEKILAALTPEQVYGEHVELRRSGKNHSGLCCFHSEKTPSFTVSPKLRFKCWGCDKEGSAFDFVMETEQTDFRGAVERLAAKAGISLNGSPPKQVPPENRMSPVESTNPSQLITVAALASDKKLPESDLLSFGLKNTSRGVQIPYFLTDGSLAPRQRIRTALSAKNGSRWDNSEGTVVPYGLPRLPEARAAGFLCLAEGESDPWTLWHHGFPCLGIPGASLTGCLEAEHLTGIPKLYLLREPDRGGVTFVAGLAKRLGEIGWNGQALVLSTAPFKDPNELHKANPELFPENFLTQLDAAELLNLEAVGVFGQLASEVTLRRIEWLWKDRIPLGKITVLDGDPGLGKSALTLDLAARVTSGSPMPDGSPCVDCEVGTPLPLGGVLVLNAEDDAADTIVPRLTAMGAKLDRVRILKGMPASDADGERQPEIPLHLAAIERAAKSVGARLIIIDPLMAFLASTTNSFRDQDVRRALAPLAGLAERLNAAIVIVRHLNKSSGEGNPLYRGGASIGIIGAARSGLLVAGEPDDESGQSRVLASTKSNLGPLPPSLRYIIEPHDDSIRVRWYGESEHKAAGLLAAPADVEERTELAEATEFLRSILEEKPLSAKELFSKAKSNGFSERTIKRAKARAGVVTWRQGFGPEGKWMWDVSSKVSAKGANNQSLAPYEQVSDSKPIDSIGSPKEANSQDLAHNDAGLAPYGAKGIKGSEGNL
jgi:hypothetical protein